MAILRGFPPSNTISPSVRIAEKDLSFVLPEQTLHRAALIGFASKGPINIPTIVASQRQLRRTFGNPHPESGDPYLIYAAEAYLLVANELYIVRVADTDPVSDESATIAEVNVPSAGTTIEVESATAGPYTFDQDSFFRWRLNGTLSEKTLVVLQDTYTVTELITTLNDQLDFQNDGIQFYESDSATISVRTLWAYGPSAELEFVSVQNAIYGGLVSEGNPTGLGTGMTTASVIGTMSMFPNVGYQTPGVYDLNGLSGLTLEVVVDGTDNVLIDNIVQTVSLADLEGNSWTANEVASEINNQRVSNGGTLPGGWIASVEGGTSLSFYTLHHGRDARLRIKPTSTAEQIFGLSTTTKIGTSPSGTTGDAADETYGRINGDTNTAGDVTFTITADTVGIEGNFTQVVVKNNTRDKNWIFEIYNNGSQVESWGQLTKDSVSTFYVGSYLSLVSDYIRVVDNTDVLAGPADGTFLVALMAFHQIQTSRMHCSLATLLPIAACMLSLKVNNLTSTLLPYLVTVARLS
jgi:hypothetical protein